jgi:toxin YoeB
VVEVRFQDAGWDDYLHWQSQDRKTLRRINQLIKDAQRQPEAGLGKPEPLTGDLAGYWSRRVDQTNRLVYRVSEGVVEIVACRGHYGDH